MKLHTGDHSVEKSANFEENQYTIEASYKAFMVLSDLYPHKELAVVRETSTNAYDSHVDAGCADKPFDVHLPTRLEPYFYVRDYGTSMTHENCMNLYTTYFRSTRNERDDAIGCLGLGSKAPYCYADSFTVEAYLNGEKRIYSGHKGKGGKPAFDLIETLQTNEPNGIKVTVAVNEKDINTFCEAAAKVYEYFKVRPNIVSGRVNYNRCVVSISAQDGSWDFCDRWENTVVMGQIPYNFNPADIISDKDNEKLRDFMEDMRGLRLYVNIGDVDITPDRESLSMNKETKENLHRMLCKVAADIKESIEGAIKSQPTLYLARKKYVEIESSCQCVSGAVDSLKDALKWNDQPLFDTMTGHKIKVHGDLIHVSKQNYRKKIEVNRDVTDIYFAKQTAFCIDDCKRGGIARIKQDIREYDRSNSIYVYKLKEGETVETCEFLNMLGGAKLEDIILTSKLDKVETNRVSSGPRDNAIIQFFDPGTMTTGSCQFSVKFEDAVYIPVKKDKVTIDGFDVSLHTVVQMLKYCCEVKHFDKKFYFVSPSMISTRKLSGRDNWEGPEYVMNMINDLFDFYKEEIIASQNASEISYENIHNCFLASSSDSNAKNIIKSYLEYKKSIGQNANRVYNIYSFARQLNLTGMFKIEGFDSKAEFCYPLNEEMKKYPLIASGVISYIYREDQIRAVAEYIDMIEANVVDMV